MRDTLTDDQVPPDRRRVPAPGPVDATTRTMLRAALAGAVGALSGCAAIGAGPRGPVTPDEGIDYRVAEAPQPTRASPGRIEVAELFWYGCPHCNALEPSLVAWTRTLPPDVAFRKVHLGLGARWVPHQRLFYALERIGRDAALDERVFRAIHVEGRALATRDEMADVLAAAGVGREAFVAAYESEAVLASMREADAFASGLGVQGVPTMVVDGRLITSAGMTGSHAATLAVVEALIVRVRARTA